MFIQTAAVEPTKLRCKVAIRQQAAQDQPQATAGVPGVRNFTKVDSTVACGGALVWNLHADAARQVLDRFDKTVSGVLQDKTDRCAMRAAAEAMIKLFGLADGERGGFFAVERAAGDKICTGLLERHIAFDHIDNIDAIEQVLNEIFWDHASTALASRQLLKNFRRAGENRYGQAGLIWITAL